MQLGMIGLGRMGGNIVRRLMKQGHTAVVYDKDPKAVAALVAEGAIGATIVWCTKVNGGHQLGLKFSLLNAQNEQNLDLFLQFITAGPGGLAGPRDPAGGRPRSGLGGPIPGPRAADGRGVPQEISVHRRATGARFVVEARRAAE
jgi:hypothetical protein